MEHFTDSTPLKNRFEVALENKKVELWAVMLPPLWFSAYGILTVYVCTPRPLGRPRRRWEDNIEVDHQEVGCESMDWIELVQDRDMWRALVNA